MTDICKGSGETAVLGMIKEVDVTAPVAEYTGQCPECGRRVPCTGYGVVLAH